MQAELPSKVVLAGPGVELYHLGKDRQFGLFTVYEKKNGQWKSFQLPKLSGGQSGNCYLKAGETRESCAIVGQPYQHTDGTIYIGSAGGVLNKMVPDGRGSYVHFYALLKNGGEDKGEMTFVQNETNVTRLSIGDELCIDPLVNRPNPLGDSAVDVSRTFFQTCKTYHEDRKLPENHSILVEQGQISEARRVTLWSDASKKVKGTKMSLAEAMKEANHLSGPERDSFLKGLQQKDSPTRKEVVRIWERNNDAFPEKVSVQKGDKTEEVNNSPAVLAAADQLKPGLSREWEGNLYDIKNRKPSWKIYDERLPIHRVNLSEMPDDSNQIMVSVMGSQYRLNHTSGTMNPVGTVAPEQGVRAVDVRGLVALGQNTFITGDMGERERVNGPKTIKVVVDKGNGDLVCDGPQSDMLAQKLQKFWTAQDQKTAEKGSTSTPRVKALFAGRRRVVSADETIVPLFIRTKHGGADLVEIDVTCDRNGNIKTVSDGYELNLSSTLNNEFMCMVGDTMLVGREIEDNVRAGCIPTVRHHMGIYQTGEQGRAVKDQVAQPVLPALPVWMTITGVGNTGVCAM